MAKKTKEKQSKASKKASESTQNESNKDGMGHENGKGPFAGVERAELEERLSKAEAEAANEKDKYLRLMAEFDNFRRRTRKEMEDARIRTEADIFTALLPMLDDYLRTLAAMEKTDNLTSIKDGIRLVGDNMMRVMRNRGLQPIETVGADFDVELHEAIHSVPVEDEAKKGKVIEEVEKGYTLNDKVIRYAKVIVGE